MFLKKLFERFGPKHMEDPYFGRLLFMKMSDPAKSYWEGAGALAAAGQKFVIEYFVDADESGPSQAQRDFCASLPSRYTELLAAVRPKLEEHFHQWTQRHIPPTFEDEFSITSVSVPRLPASPMTWEVSFQSKSDEHLFTVTLIDWTPTHVSIDG